MSRIHRLLVLLTLACAPCLQAQVPQRISSWLYDRAITARPRPHHLALTADAQLDAMLRSFNLAMAFARADRTDRSPCFDTVQRELVQVLGRVALFRYRYGVRPESLSKWPRLVAMARDLLPTLAAAARTTFDRDRARPCLAVAMYLTSDREPALKLLQRDRVSANSDPWRHELGVAAALCLSSIYLHDGDLPHARQALHEARSVEGLGPLQAASVTFDAIEATLLYLDGKSSDAAQRYQAIYDLHPGTLEADLARSSLLGLHRFVEPTLARFDMYAHHAGCSSLDRPNIAEAMARHHVPGGFSRLLAWMRSADSDSRDFYIRALGACDDQRAVPILRRKLAHGEPESRRDAALALCRLGAVNHVSDYLRLEDLRAAKAAADTDLGLVFGPKLLPEEQDYALRDACEDGPSLDPAQLRDEVSMRAAWTAWAQAQLGN